MRIFVTGGTGFVGSHIIENLLKEGHEVVVMTRSSADSVNPTEKKIRKVQGDLFNKDSIKEHLRNIDAIIHLVGIIVEARGEGSFEKVHYEGTKYIVDSAVDMGIRKYIHMSALGAEEGAKSKYHQSKYIAEEYVKASGLDYTIFKPSVIHGEGDVFVNMYAKMMRLSPFVPIIGNGRVKMQPVYVNDVATLFTKAVSEEKYSNQTYEVGGPDKLSFDEIVDTIARVVGKTRFKVHMPIGFMKLNASLMQPVMKKPPISKDQLIMLEKDNTCDIKRVKEDFNIEFISFKESIKKYLR